MPAGTSSVARCGLLAAGCLGCLLGTAGAVETDEAAGAVGAGPVPEAASELVSPTASLPDWTEADVREFELNGRPTNLGGGLWPAEEIPLDPVPERLEPLPPPFSPDDLPPFVSSPPQTPDVIPGQALATYFGDRPASYVVDPQGLLEAPFDSNIARFLDYHARRGDPELFVLVLGQRQSPPVHISTRDLWQRWFPDPASGGAIIFYPIGEPDHAAVEFGDSPVVGAGIDRLRQTLDASVKDSLQAGEPSAQLDRFCVQLSVQIAWIVRDLGLKRAAGAPGDGAGAEGEGRGAAAATGRAIATALGIGLAVGLVVLGIRRVWLRPRRFPELEIPQRLGGDHCGGAHAVLSFGAEVPVAPPGRSAPTSGPAG